MQVLRTPEERFAEVADYPFAPNYHTWTEPGGTELRMHYVDEGEGPPVLLLHGQPNWSWLYREFIPPLVEAGYRCIAPDHIGFGKSDKVVEDEWYVIERHCEAVRSLIDALDLRSITLVCHDWGGPIGLRQAADLPARFDRLVIMNTWLHHIDMQYTPAMRAYNARIVEIEPGSGDPLAQMTANLGAEGRLGDIVRAFTAPFPDPSYMAGPRRFPLLHPYAKPVEGNAVEQARCYEELRHWPKPANVIFGHADGVFPPEWGRQWADTFPLGTFDMVETEVPHHFIQLSQAPEIVEIMLERGMRR